MTRTVLPLIALLILPTGWASAEEPVDWDMVSRIRDEGFHRSQVMDVMSHLTDTIGPRLTGSPQMKEANEWTRQKMEDWGLANAHLEAFEFGRGWSFDRASVHMIEPLEVPLLALPQAWTRGTKGKVKGEVVRIEIGSAEDLEEHKGTLKGKIVLVVDPRRDSDRSFGRQREPRPRRFSEDDLQELETFEVPGDGGGDWRSRFRGRRQLRKKVQEFLVEEKALATLSRSSRKNGILRVAGGGSREADDPKAVTGLLLGSEHFQRIERFLDDDWTVKLEIEVEARFHEETTEAFNTLAEIPGTDPAGEIVMAGGHLDSWHGGTGATDNAAGCAVMMEAARILQALGVKPKRTIRIALWGGEEQGLLGSRAYVKEHFASRPEPPEGEDANPFEERWPLTLKPGHEKLSAYFNLDNGAGRIRGVWAQENAAIKPIFEAWLKPFEDLEATTVTLRNTSGTDHLPFDSVGLPGFQMIQDQLDYFTKTHHTNLDVLDLVEAKDLKQASVIMASFLYHAAMRDELLPRKPLPKEPEDVEEAGGKEAEGEGEKKGRRGRRPAA